MARRAGCGFSAGESVRALCGKLSRDGAACWNLYNPSIVAEHIWAELSRWRRLSGLRNGGFGKLLCAQVRPHELDNCSGRVGDSPRLLPVCKQTASIRILPAGLRDAGLRDAKDYVWRELPTCMTAPTFWIRTLGRYTSLHCLHYIFSEHSTRRQDFSRPATIYLHYM